ISRLLGALNKYWPSLSCGSPSTCHGTGSFWAHEVKFWSYTLFFYQILSLYDTDTGYVPSNTERYPLGGIVFAIENFHATPQLTCSKGAVEELQLCFYKDFTPRDCVIKYGLQNNINASKSSCPKYVSLPSCVSLGKFLVTL
ncbi:LOW QUALITY PROTEIN: Ribonuclease_T2 domain-containing protein, partial [Cephalotus follicularis]